MTNTLKLIHCSDLHLDSRLSSNYSERKAQERRRELLGNFLRLIDRAGAEGACGMLLCGDIFDSESVSRETLRLVEQGIRRYPSIHFFYLCGNHDVHCPLFEEDPYPPHFHTFGTDWTSYTLLGEGGQPRLCISGISFAGRPAAPLLSSLSLNPSCINIVLLHGTAAGGEDLRLGTDDCSASPREEIPLPLLRGRNIDYLALGHIHAPSAGRLDARGVCVYPGCLEGRGFDECGEHGYEEITAGPGRQISHRFVPFARRHIHSLTADCTGCADTWEIAGRIRSAMEQESCRPGDLVRVTLTGETGPDFEPDTLLLQREGEALCSLFVLRNELVPAQPGGKYLSDISLKGEFVRAVLADQELDDSRKADVIRCGLRALSGEELFL